MQKDLGKIAEKESKAILLKEVKVLSRVSLLNGTVKVSFFCETCVAEQTIRIPAKYNPVAKCKCGTEYQFQIREDYYQRFF